MTFTRAAPVLLLVTAIACDEPRPPGPAPTLLYTDSLVNPGAVFYQGQEGERLLLQIEGQHIRKAVVGPDGTVYFIGTMPTSIMRWTGESVSRVYHHSGRIRDIAFGADGLLYFSQASGRAANGRIFRLKDGSAIPVFTVALAAIGGHWDGDFALSPDNKVYLASGAVQNARIVRMDDQSTTELLQAPGGATSLAVDQRGDLYFVGSANWIFKLPRGGSRQDVIQLPSRALSDLHVLERAVTIGPEAGRVNNVATHPTNRNVLYAATPGGGIYRSYDRGLNWFLTGEGLRDARADGMIVHPDNPSLVFAATPSGIFVSSDAGQHWFHRHRTDPVGPDLIDSYYRGIAEAPLRSPMVMDPDGQRMYAAPFCAGVFEGRISGPWRRIYGHDDRRDAFNCVTSMTFSGGALTVATVAGVLRRKPSGGFDTIYDGRSSHPIEVRTRTPSSGRIYLLAIARGGGVSHIVWLQPAAGAPWQGLPGHVTDWSTLMSMALHPTDQGEMYVGWAELSRSNDDGATPYVVVGCTPPGNYDCSDGVDYRGLTYDRSGTILWAGIDQGVRMITDLDDNGTSEMDAADVGLTNTQFYAMDVGSGGSIFGGTQDRFGKRKVGFGVWTGTASGGGVGDLTSVLVDPTNDLHLYWIAPGGKVYRSANGGQSADGSNSIPGLPVWWAHALLKQGSTMWVGTAGHGVYKSTDSGVSFSPANNGIANDTIRALAGRSGRQPVLYAGLRNKGLYRSRDGGSSWARVESFPETGVLALAVRGNRIVAGTRTGILISHDDGVVWKEKNIGLPPSRAVSEVIIDPACWCRLYAGLGFIEAPYMTGGGVYESIDGGEHWRRLSATAELNQTVTSIRIDPLDRSRLYIATYGHGIQVLFRGKQPPCACN